ncbi:MAG: response regulator [Chloroflexi bacterium]|nr:response regulator [Chloroflexota bacterium]
MAAKTILVVEDNVDNLDLVRFVLEQDGFSVLSTWSGAEGLALARQHHPDLILLDLTLPELDGWAAARALKSDPATRDIPLVALTAHSLAGDREKALAAGCDGYLTKPMDVIALPTEVRRFLRLG